jgi:hypothetical protein
MNRGLKILAVTLKGLLAFVVGYLFIGWALPKVPVAAIDDSGKDVCIYILTNGVHTDIVLPRTNEALKSAGQRHALLALRDVDIFSKYPQ